MNQRFQYLENMQVAVGELERLREERIQLEVMRDQLDEKIAAAVESARAVKTPWEAIAEALDLTPQGVRYLVKKVRNSA